MYTKQQLSSEYKIEIVNSVENRIRIQSIYQRRKNY